PDPGGHDRADDRRRAGLPAVADSDQGLRRKSAESHPAAPPTTAKGATREGTRVGVGTGGCSWLTAAVVEGGDWRRGTLPPPFCFRLRPGAWGTPPNPQGQADDDRAGDHGRDPSLPVAPCTGPMRRLIVACLLASLPGCTTADPPSRAPAPGPEPA